MALEDLKKVMADYNKQASDNTSDEARAAERGIEEVNQRIAERQAELGKIDQEIDAAENRMDRLNQELAGAKPAKEAQERRTRMEASLASKEAERDKAEARARSWMHQFATAILSEELVEEASAVIKQEDTRRKLPAPYDRKFVDEILDDGICVCGRPIEQGSSEYEKIKTLLDTAGDQAVMSRVMSTTQALARLAEKADRAWSEQERNNEDRKRIEGELQRLDADIQEISRELANNPITDVAEKEAARERARQQKRQAENRKMELLTLISGLERQKIAYESTRNALVQKSEAARRFVKRAQLAAALTARLQARLQQEEEVARKAIEQDIDAIVRRFMRKPFNVRLDKDYQLRLFDEKGAEVAKSTGENQLLGLAFTGAIAKYAKEREDSGDDILLPGTVAPLVVDSPFGHLDPLYRRGVAEFLPALASQVILLVSTSQASDAVMDTLDAKIGDEYVLTRHNLADGADKQPEVISIRGRTYDLTRYNSEIEGTCITEVK
jgi:DNA sulfur modification protein DndD